MRLSRYLTWADLGLGGLLLAGSLAGLLWLGIQPRGQTCLVMEGDEVFGRFNLSQDTSLLIEGPIGRTRLEIEDGYAWIAEAPCPDQLCRRMGRISQPGEVLICLPNQIFVYIEGEGELDAITR